MRNVIVLILLVASLMVAGATQKPAGSKPTFAQHYACSKCHALMSPKEAKDADYKCTSCQGKMTVERGLGAAAIECPKCNGKWDIMLSKTFKGKCPHCKTQLAPYMPPMHMECPSCQAQWTDMESVNLKRKCPACGLQLQKLSGRVDASFVCKKDRMKWSQAAADKLKNKCPKCKGDIKKVVPK